MGRRGYSLTELLVVVLIVFVGVGGLLLVLSESGRNTWLTTEAQVDSQTEAQRVLDRISEDVRDICRPRVRCPAAGPQLQIGVDGAPNEIEYTFAGGVGTATLDRKDENGTIRLASRLAAFSVNPPTTPTCTLTGTPTGVLTIQVTSRGVAQIRAGATGGRPYNQALTASVFLQLETCP